MEAVSEGAFSAAQAAATLALGLIGIMALWLGVMRLAERAGLVQLLARALQPVMRRLFPDVPRDHPAMGAMVMNMAANMLGLGNAATPLGLRAMALLNQLNPRPGIASNAMCTFLTINTASIQLIPTTAIGILAIQGSTDPTAFVPAAVLATACGLTCGIFVAKTLERLPIFAVPPEDPGADREVKAADALPEGDAIAVETVQPPPLTPARKAALIVFLLAFAAMFVVIAAPAIANAWPVLIGADWRFPD